MSISPLAVPIFTAPKPPASSTSPLAVSAAAHLTAAKGIITRADLDGPSLCATDPFTGGPDYDGPVIRMNDLPGIGISAVPCDFT